MYGFLIASLQLSMLRIFSYNSTSSSVTKAFAPQVTRLLMRSGQPAAIISAVMPPSLKPSSEYLFTPRFCKRERNTELKNDLHVHQRKCITWKNLKRSNCTKTGAAAATANANTSCSVCLTSQFLWSPQVNTVSPKDLLGEHLGTVVVVCVHETCAIIHHTATSLMK